MAGRWRIDPMLVVVSCCAFGAFASVDRAATLVVALSCALFWRTRLRRRALACALLALCIGWARGSWLIACFEAAQARALDVVPSPTACAVRGRVLSSPVLHGGV